MGFDTKKFKNADFKDRVETVPVPELKEFFEKDEKPVWKVRNLTGIEVGRINETGDKYKRLGAASKAMDGNDKEKVEAFKTLFGISETMSSKTAMHTEVLIAGSVEPLCDVGLASMIRDRFPVAFANITGRIYKLTGMGAEPGKPKSSGDAVTSEQV